MKLILNNEGFIEIHQDGQVFYPASEKHSKNIVSRSLKIFGPLDPETAMCILYRGVICRCAYLYNDQAYFME